MVKFSRYRPGLVQREGRGIALLFHDCGTSRWWAVSNTPRLHFTPEKDPVPILRRLGGPQGRSGRTENLVPTWIRSRNVQPVYGLSYLAHIWALIAIEYRPSGSIDCISCMDVMMFVYSDLGDITVLRLGRSLISHWKDWKGNCLARKVRCHGQWKLKKF